MYYLLRFCVCRGLHTVPEDDDDSKRRGKRDDDDGSDADSDEDNKSDAASEDENHKVVLGCDGDILIPDWKSKDQTDAFSYDGIISNSLLLKSGLNGWADRIREVIVSDSDKVSDNVS